MTASPTPGARSAKHPRPAGMRDNRRMTEDPRVARASMDSIARLAGRVDDSQNHVDLVEPDRLRDETPHAGRAEELGIGLRIAGDDDDRHRRPRVADAARELEAGG